MLVKITDNQGPPLQSDTESKEEKLIWLMDKYGDMVVRVAFSYLKQKQLAEDVSQEVFISCYQNLEGFQKKAAYKTWLYRITVNKCKDVLKSWSYKNLFYKEWIGSLLADRMDSVETELLHIENKEYLYSRVLRLPLKMREVIILHYYEELTLAEISDLLSLNMNTVKSRLHRARNSLKDVLSEKGDEQT